MDKDMHAILYEVNYCSSKATLMSEQIEQIQSKFINKLSLDLGVIIKSWQL